jgi:3-methyladenine DNA glycosylase AlkC
MQCALTALKDQISPELVRALARDVERAWPGFDREGFVAAAAGGLEELELLARLSHIARALGDHLPDSFAEAAAVLDRALASETLTGWITLACNEYVATHGIEEPDTALPLLARLTPRWSSESAIRPFIERHPELTFRYLRRWATDPDEHVRRLVSEGTRPRLPWAPQLRSLRADPRPALELLDQLVLDRSEYVRRSVANHLNDISKDHPGLALETARRWQRRGADGVVRHGLRTLLKQGDPQALALLGFDPEAAVTLEDLSVTPARVAIGGTVEIAFTLAAGEAPAEVMVDYRIHHAGARGPRSAKVFKLTTRTLQPGRPQRIARRHTFREVSVRRIHPGVHLVEVQVNGRVVAAAEVLVE